MGLFLEGLIIGGNFAFQNGLGLTIKTANCNFPWAYTAISRKVGGKKHKGARDNSEK